MPITVVQSRPNIRITLSSSFNKNATFSTELAADLISLQTHKDISEASGMWSMSLVHHFSSLGTSQNKTPISWLQKIKPMDYIVIEMARFGSQNTSSDSGGFVVVMRGFVDNVCEVRSVNDDGSPIQYIMVNGRDFGKILETTQVWYNPTVDVVPLLSSELQFTLKYGGVSGDLLSPADFISQIIATMIDKRLDAMSVLNPAVPSSLPVQATGGSGLQISGQAFQQFTGPLYDLLSQYSNAPWGELFIDEGPESPILVSRFTPFRGKDGLLPSLGTIGSGAQITSLAGLDSRDIIQVNLSFSDNEVYTYYFTFVLNTLYDTMMTVTAGINNSDPTGLTPGKFPNPYADVSKIPQYGIRVLEAETPWIQILPDPLHPGETPPSVIETASSLNQWLWEVFGHNETLRSGQITVMGNPSLRAGGEISFSDFETGASEGAPGETFYIQSVEHDFTVFESFTTTLTVSRGQTLGIGQTTGLGNLAPLGQKG